MDEYIIRAMNGDKDAFTLIFLKLQKKLYNIAFSRLKNDFDACDAIQETMIIVYNNLKKLQKPSSYESWIITILINECNKIYSKKNKVATLNIDDINEILTEKNKTESDLVFYDLLKDLSDREQIILILYFQNNYTSKQIGKILNIKDNSVKSIIKRAKTKLKKEIKEVF